MIGRLSFMNFWYQIDSVILAKTNFSLTFKTITWWLYWLFEFYKVYISMFMILHDLWKNNKWKRMIGRLSFFNFWYQIDSVILANTNFSLTCKAITWWLYWLFEFCKVHISLFMILHDLWKKNKWKRMIGRLSFINFW